MAIGSMLTNVCAMQYKCSGVPGQFSGQFPNQFQGHHQQQFNGQQQHQQNNGHQQLPQQLAGPEMS